MPKIMYMRFGTGNIAFHPNNITNIIVDETETCLIIDTNSGNDKRFTIYTDGKWNFQEIIQWWQASVDGRDYTGLVLK